MQKGIVKWFNNAKGYGFILAEDGTSDVFVHYSSIEMNGYKTLKAGQEVAFNVEPGPKGLHVTHLEVAGNPLQNAQMMDPQQEKAFTQSEKMANDISTVNRDMYET